jgi:hypothetical protein
MLLNPSLGQAANSTTAEAKRHFERALIIVLENQNYEDAISDPYLGSLAKRGASFTDFHGLFHPSYSNYLAMVSGRGITTFRDIQINVNYKTIADLLKSKGLAWKNYAEGYPGNCFKGSTYGRYARKHAPFISFISIQKNECGNVVPAAQFVKDLKNNSLPNYAFYSPDLDDDGHDPSYNPKEGLTKASSFLKKFLGPLLQNHAFMKDTLIVVTFDESKDQSSEYRNHIYTVFLGNMVKHGEYGTAYNHYNVLRTIEENFGLSIIAEGDGGAKPITDAWR